MNTSPLLPALCVTRDEFAAMLHVSVRTVDRMIAAGEIEVRRVRGKAVRILRSDAERYLTGGNRPGTGETKTLKNNIQTGASAPETSTNKNKK